MTSMTKVKPEPDLPDLGREKWLTLWPERWRWRVSLVLALLLLIAGGLAWYNREQIAADVIDDTLREYGLEATYEIEDIGTRRQVIRNLVIGDPNAPDLTAERVSLNVSYTYGPPEIGRIELVRPRLFATFRDGTLSFGSLDPLVFAESDEPAGLPALDLRIIDGRALVQSDYGDIGAKLEGAGRLDDGFAGKLAATAPGIGIEGCAAQAATLYGDISSESGRLTFDGPLRLRQGVCEGASINTADIGVQMILASDFASVEGDLALAAQDLSAANLALSKISGSADVAWRFDGEFSLRHDLDAQGLSTDFADFADIGAEGTLRSRDGFTRSEWNSRLTGQGIDARQLVRGSGMAEARQAAAGTFVGSLIGKFENAIARAVNDASFAGNLSLRSQPESLRFVIPEARLRSSSGDTVLALSRLSYASASKGQPDRLSGNILTGGAGLPRINARLQQSGDGTASLRMTMAQYREGNDAIAIPRLDARQDASGRIAFTGMIQAQGSVPGGSVRGLSLPVEGGWAQGSGVTVGSRCLEARFASLEAYDLSLANQSLSLCPDGAPAIVRFDDELKISARTNALSLNGRYGDEPVSLAISGASLRYPGGFDAQGIEASLGSGEDALRFAAASFDGSLSGPLEGQFSGGSADLGSVPVNVADIAGTWKYAEDAFQLRGGSFTLSDRPDLSSGGEARFEPVNGTGASVDLIDGVVTGELGIENPWSGRRLANVAFNHDLDTAKGRADFTVPGIEFDEGFQPEELTSLTKGLIAFADGVIEGSGQFAWEGEELTSTGTFSTDGFDFAAAFGPVRQVKGTIEFTDLIALTTAPSQVATIGSVNTGIEVLDGRLVYSIENGTLISLEDGRWPFMGGELILRPVKLDYGGGQGQSYIFEIVALDAATFVTQMELSNLGASGRFDGTIPIIFDAQGNGTIQGGLLISRPPGGNVSYVGELTYEDLGTMANYAFQTLRSLDYNQMAIELNGNLAGEIVTNFNIDGVRQGAGTSQNFITRQLADLPIRFKINVRSENFYLLATIVRGLFDPTVFGDPIDRGLFKIEGGQIVPRSGGVVPIISPIPEPAPEPAPGPAPDEPVPNDDDNPTPGEAERRNEPLVQPPESDPDL